VAEPPHIPITRPLLGEAEARAVGEVLASGWLAMGARTAAFERAFAETVGATHAVAVASGTAALHLGLLAAGIGPGDEVIVPSLSFVASANVVLHAGARPVLVDVDPRSGNLDPAAAEAAIGPRTRALMPVHQLGLPAALDELRALAERRGLLLVEDAACALGSSYGGRPIGGASRLCCFSFHPRKVITTGEGGMVCTDDAALADKLRLLRNQGITLPAAARHQSRELVFEEIALVGYNARLTDVQAAIGLAQLERLPGILSARRRLAERYLARLAGLRGVELPVEPGPGRSSYQSFMVVLEEPRCRRAVMQQLLDHGIDSRRGVMAIHRTAAYRKLEPGLSLPVSERLARRGLILPLYPQMTDEEQDRVVMALAEAVHAA